MRFNIPLPPLFLLAVALCFSAGCGQNSELTTRTNGIETSARLKYILRALSDYRQEKKRYPDHLQKDHSWRVEILDRLDGDEMAKKFDKSQVWDSEANEAATNCNVEAFTSLRSESPSSAFTNFVLVVDDGTVFNKKGVLSDSEIKDGTSNTAIMLEIIDSDIVWSEPRDITIDEAIKLIQSFPQSLEPRIGMADMSILSVSPTASAEEIRSIFLANDGKGVGEF